MWDVILQILSIIGIVLLVLLGILLAVLSLILFFPVFYKVNGSRTGEGETRLCARADWLFGLFRVRFAYPEPGTFRVKLLWKTLYDSGHRKDRPDETGKKEKGRGAAENAEDSGECGKQARESGAESAEAGKPQTLGEGNSHESEGDRGVRTDSEEGNPRESEGGQNAQPDAQEPDSQDTGEAPAGIWGKISRIRYTICNLYDKIKEILADLSYYAELLREETTRQLFGHVRLRLGRMLRNLRPRRIRADVLFGTGAPDTTGYVFGIYSMFSAALGPGVCVTPDFTRAVLQGTVDISGHITGFVLLWNVLKLALDKKLHLFLKKMKTRREKDGR